MSSNLGLRDTELDQPSCRTKPITYVGKALRLNRYAGLQRGHRCRLSIEIGQKLFCAAERLKGLYGSS